ncbi:MAG: hypothetical protein PWP04_1449 [Candidatus Atribacteria bacterium]|nr:hypothetical protein [Candidatus Atribacteria bacterium]
MRSRDFYWVLALIASVGFLAFLGFQLWQKLNFQEESNLLALSPAPSPVTSSSSLEEIKEEELFLASYPEQELSNFRNLFRPVAPVAEEQLVISTEGYEEEATFLPPQEVVLSPAVVEEEPLPPIRLQGVVVSGARQAVIVEVGGKIQILTNEKNSSSKIKLIKTEGEEVVLSYEGREIRLTLEE